MKILLLGRFGQLGWELERTLAPLGELIAFDYPDIDLRKPESIRGLIRENHPEVIVNATAYTAVDRAEEESDIAMAINGGAVATLAEEAFNLGSGLVHFSTDYVFDGGKGEAYVETDLPAPLNVYGQSKLAGEEAIKNMGGDYLILRTSWVYSLRRDCFVTKVLDWARKHQDLRIVDDQVSNPTWCRMLAEMTSHLLSKGSKDIIAWLREFRGLYHLAGDGEASRFEWAEAILRYDPREDEQITTMIQPASTSEFPTLARRPLHSALSCDLFSETFGLRLPPWEQALQLAMAQE
jgi:dTDP-4-dehydrorhamnose reductase